jgi:hypothetical protein
VQPPSSITSLREITESQELEPVPLRRRQYRHLLPALRLPQEPPRRPSSGDDGAPDDAPSLSSTRSPRPGQPPPSRRWQPALRGSQLLEPAPPTPPTSGPPHRREPQPGQPDSRHSPRAGPDRARSTNIPRATKGPTQPRQDRPVYKIFVLTLPFFPPQDCAGALLSDSRLLHVRL